MDGMHARVYIRLFAKSMAVGNAIFTLSHLWDTTGTVRTTTLSCRVPTCTGQAWYAAMLHPIRGVWEHQTISLPVVLGWPPQLLVVL